MSPQAAGLLQGGGGRLGGSWCTDMGCGPFAARLSIVEASVCCETPSYARGFRGLVPRFLPRLSRWPGFALDFRLVLHWLLLLLLLLLQ